jgi:phosphoglycolate phosphatase
MNTPTPLKNCEAVLFDLDGTLLHTVPDLAVAVNAMRVDLGYSVLPEALVSQFVGKGAENLVHRSLTGQMHELAPQDQFSKAYPLFQQHYDRVNGQHAQFYDGVLEGLTQMAQMGLRLAVVTNKPARYTLPLLQVTGLHSFFAAVVCGDTCAHKKPHPLPLLYACETIGVLPEAALMVGDSLNDAQAAQAAGIPCWLVPYGYNEDRDILQTPCAGHIQSLLQAATILQAA